MKGHFSIGILLVFCAYGALGASNLFKRHDEAEKQKLMIELNQVRWKIAEQAPIANMHELYYDQELENEMQTISCFSIKPGGYIIPFPSEKEAMELANKLQNTPADQQQAAVMTFVQTILPLFNPVETKIGCAERKDCGVHISGVCAVGPNKNPSTTDVIKGPLGSACPNGPGPVGLCKPSNVGEFGKGEDNGSSKSSSLIALLLIVLLI
ncbi:hypothetical protein B9Z55_012101 [Caenorhabditis nigoni]|uniref:SCP domain-containing protein n=1 Tax=Caenorhabditis nigoni TaxID=1611254 RepID=A0A2G5TVP2_9PELO|nr:hypothetical protein B9Z55_012101 [Caenorhabditis nigoni]